MGGRGTSSQWRMEGPDCVGSEAYKPSLTSPIQKGFLFIVKVRDSESVTACGLSCILSKVFEGTSPKG